MAEPLRILTRKGESFSWGLSQETSFQALKDAISNNLELVIFDTNAPTFVTVDASDIGLGAQLSQLQDGRDYRYSLPLTRSRIANETSPLMKRRRLLVFGLWSAGRSFSFLRYAPTTAHSSRFLKQHTTTRKSAKFIRWLERLSRFDYDVEHTKGSNNSAVCHCRPAMLPSRTTNHPELMANMAALSSSPISIEAIRNHPKQDKLLAQVIHFSKSGWPAKKHVEKTLLSYYNVRDELSVEEGCLTRAEHRFVIPTAMQQTILNTAHEGHSGIVRAKRQLRLTYWWPGMDNRVENHVKHCIACQDSAKSHKPAKVPLTRIEAPTQPWTKNRLGHLRTFRYSTQKPTANFLAKMRHKGRSWRSTI